MLEPLSSARCKRSADVFVCVWPCRPIGFDVTDIDCHKSQQCLGCCQYPHPPQYSSGVSVAITHSNKIYSNHSAVGAGEDTFPDALVIRCSTFLLLIIYCCWMLLGPLLMLLGLLLMWLGSLLMLLGLLLIHCWCCYLHC